MQYFNYSEFMWRNPSDMMNFLDMMNVLPPKLVTEFINYINKTATYLLRNRMYGISIIDNRNEHYPKAVVSIQASKFPSIRVFINFETGKEILLRFNCRTHEITGAETMIKYNVRFTN